VTHLGPGNDRSHPELDRNQDNRVSMVEAQADDAVRAAFSSADRNADGYLSEQEYFDWRNGSNAAPRSAPSREPAAPPAPSRQPVPPTPDASDPTGQ